VERVDAEQERGDGRPGRGENRGRQAPDDERRQEDVDQVHERRPVVDRPLEGEQEERHGPVEPAAGQPVRPGQDRADVAGRDPGVGLETTRSS